MKRALPVLVVIFACLGAVAWLGWMQFGRIGEEQALERAIGLTALGDTAEARPILERAYRANARSLDGLVAVALYVCNVDEGQAARTPPSVRTTPRDRALALAAARRLLLAHRYGAAEPLFLLSLTGHDTGEVEARQSLALIYKLQGRLEDARKVFCDGLAMMPDPVVTLRELHEIVYGPYPVESTASALDQAFRGAPNDPGVGLARAHLAFARGDLGGARATLEKAIASAGEWPRLMEAARALERRIAMQGGDALGLARSLSQTKREWFGPRGYGEVWSWTARMLGNAEEEREALEFRLSNPPIDFGALGDLTELSMRMADRDTARDWSQRKATLQKALEQYRDHLYFAPDPIALAETQQALAEQLGLFPEQQAWLRLALKRDPGNASLRTSLQLWQPAAAPEVPSSAPSQADLVRILQSDAQSMAGKASGGAPPAVRFEDRASLSGLGFQYEPGKARRRDLPETMGGGLAVFDFDRDGWMDLYATQGGRFPPPEGVPCADRLFRNRGDGTFEDVSERSGIAGFAGGYGMGVAIGDIDNDGYQDIFVTRWNAYALYRNRGDGTFEDATERMGLTGARDWPSSAAFADIDNDGDLDLYVCHYLVWDAENPLGTRPGRASDMVRYNNPLNYLALPDHLFRNDGDRFTDISREAGITDADKDGRGLGVVAAQLDAGLETDFFVANDLTANFLFRNLGQSRFEEIGEVSGVSGSGEGLYQGSMGVVCADFDRDGLFDLAATNFYGDSMSLHKGLGHGLFIDITSALGLKSATRYMVGWGMACNDFNLDGWPDLVMANGHLDEPRDGSAYSMPTQLFLGRREAPFVAAGAEAGPALGLPRVSRALVAADLDNDGRVDIVIGSHDHPLAYLRNETDAAGSFLTLALEGRRSNRDGVGARVTVSTGGAQWVGQRMGGGSYQSSGDARLHFGLGGEAKARVVVEWPSGQVDTHENLATNRAYTLVEGQPDARAIDTFPGLKAREKAGDH